MTLDKILKWDVLNLNKLVREGYVSTTYYCGNYSCQKLYTKLRKHFEKLGVRFIYNPACFKHDACYHTRPTLIQKIKIDYVFYQDMIKLLNRHFTEPNHVYKKLLFRAKLFYFLVTLMTPLYVFQNKIKKNGN